MATVVDLEVAGRCNAACRFCPRDRAPHEGLMPPDVFGQVLGRVIEFRARVADLPDPDVTISFCGSGEPLLNEHLPDYVRQSRAAGLRVTVDTNGSLLDAR